MTLDLFTQEAGIQRTAEAIERADAAVATAPHGDALIAAVTGRIVAMCRNADHPYFSGDDVAVVLDQMGVARDQATRKRIVSTLINRGKGKLWTADGWMESKDARRHGRPLMRWRLLTLTSDGMAGRFRSTPTEDGANGE